MDGDGGDAAWAHAPMLVVTAVPEMEMGQADPMRVALELRACATKDATFLRLRWDDAASDDADGLVIGWTQGDVQPRGLPGKPRDTRWRADPNVEPGPDLTRGTWRDGRWTVEVRRAMAPGDPGFLVPDIHDTDRGAALAIVRVRWGHSVRVADFEADEMGEAPKGLRSAHAGEGRPGAWRVRPASAGAEGKILVQEDGQGSGMRFPLTLLDGLSAKDVDVSVRFQARHGSEDRGAGVLWRAKGDHDFYVLRADALAKDVVSFVTKDDRRADLLPVDGEKARGAARPFDPAAWHVLRVTVVGDRMQAYLDGRRLFDVVDGTITGAGTVGLWTKADSVIAFDDLVVVTLDPPAAPGNR